MKINNRTPQFLATISIILTILITGCKQDPPPTLTKPTTPNTKADDQTAQPAPKPTHAQRLEKLRATLLKTQPQNTSPYQIQLGFDEKINGTIIGERPNLNLNFENQDQKPINLATAYPGKILVISTIFTSCPLPDMCPRLTNDFAQLAASIPLELRDEVQLILVSFDPQRDTPAVLKAYGRQHALDFEITDLLCGTIEQTQPLLEDALQIPLEVNPETNMIVTHAMMLHIIDRNGYIVVERTVSNSAPMQTIAEEVIRAALLPFDPAKVPALPEDDQPDDG